MGDGKVYKRDFSNELQYEASKSSGPGGQNVNKVNSKITLRFDILSSDILDEAEKKKLFKKAKNKINNEGEVVIQADNNRSQLKNKEEAVNRFYQILKEVFKQKKKRKPTKPTKASKEKRIKAKKAHSEKKKLRQKPF